MFLQIFYATVFQNINATYWRKIKLSQKSAYVLSKQKSFPS